LVSLEENGINFTYHFSIAIVGIFIGTALSGIE
jgi:hypothetical protein